MQGWAVELQFQLLPSQTLRATPDGSVRKGKKEEEKCRQVDRRTRKKTSSVFTGQRCSLCLK